jgi:hypothetical protein
MLGIINSSNVDENLRIIKEIKNVEEKRLFCI